MPTEKQSDTIALAEYDEAIRLHPNSAEVYFNRGKAKRQTPSAIADFDEAIRCDPNFADAYFYRGCLKDYLAQSESMSTACHEARRSAIADFDEAIRLDLDFPERLHAYYRRGLIKYNLDRYEEAIVDFDEALSEIKQGDPECLIAEIQELREESVGMLNFYEEGIAGITERIRQNPTDIRDYKTRGESNGFLGRMPEAKADFQKILELTTDTQVITEIERHLQELGNPDYWQQYSWRTES
ncbi:MAG: tetratricopeptide repeat protein [Candidatus Poribacteria bacterium]|nr:tetratricopeptide repeat protein [Candidatus Poribacteria bacterium]